MNARLLRLAAAAFVGAALVLVIFPDQAGASTPTKSGWWDMTPAGTLPNPSPPPSPSPTTTLPIATTLPPAAPTTLPAGTPVTSTTVPSTSPKGTLVVGFDGKGDTAIAAVQYVVPLVTPSGQRTQASSIEALLTLTLDKAGTAGTPVLLACPTTSAWSAGPAQSAKKAPKYRCSGGRGAPGMYNSGSDTVTFDLSRAQESAARPGVFSVAIVPAPKLKASAVFSATFAKPGGNSFQVLASTSTGGVPGGFAPPPYTPPPSPASVVTPGSVGSSSQPSGGGYSFSSPSSSASPAGAAGGSVGASAGTSPAGTSSVAPRYSLGPSTLASGHGISAQTQRNLAIALLVILGIAAAAASGRQARRPRLLVPIATRAGAGARSRPAD